MDDHWGSKNNISYLFLAIQKSHQSIKDGNESLSSRFRFWNIQYNSLLNLAHSGHRKMIAIADDQQDMTREKTILEAENFLNYLQKITNWACKNKIRFNEHKSKAIRITRWTSINIFPNNKRIEVISKFKYLGIITDKKFTLRGHLQYSVDIWTKLINALSKSAKLEWGLKYGTLRTIHTGPTLPLLSYVAPIWNKALTKKYNRKILAWIQCLMNIRISKEFRNTSSEALCVLTGLTPIKIKLKKKNIKKYDLKEIGIWMWKHH